MVPNKRKIWIDVEDFFAYFEDNPRPSGIQRLVFETLRVLPQQAHYHSQIAGIGFVRHSHGAGLLAEVTLGEIAEVFESAAVSSLAGKKRARQGPRRRIRKPFEKRLRLWLIGIILKLPQAPSEALLRAGVLQMAVLRHVPRLLAMLRTPTRVTRRAKLRKMARTEFDGKPGDILLIIGAPWTEIGYAAYLKKVRLRYQLEAALLLYDLIPIRRPEWCAADLVTGFRTWLQETLPQCSRLMAISHATARDVEAYAQEQGVSLGQAVQPVPIGTDFATPNVRGDAQPRGLPRAGSYVLFVSTLEARKNHIVLFRLWSRLMRERPRSDVPTLVFAGRVGWLVSDLIQQLENTSWLDGKIRLFRDPTDAELRELYSGCRFTIFPSLFEGWGLPVSESLGRGQPCLSSNRTSLPESGGDLARYFDPEDMDDAHSAVCALLDNPEMVDAWRERVRLEYRHVSWETTAAAIISGCLQTSDVQRVSGAEMVA